MEAKHGREIQQLSVFPEEREVLFAPGTRFQVLDSTADESGTTTIYMDEVD